MAPVFRPRVPRRAGSLALAVLIGACSGSPPGDEGPVEIDLSRHDPEVAALFRELVDAAKSAPQDAGPRGRLGMAYEANDLPELAIASYEQAIGLDPSEPRWWYHAAVTSFSQGELERAVAWMDSAIVRDDRYAPAHWRRGHWLLAMGDFERAEASFRRASELKPNHPAGWLGLARLRLLAGKEEEAEKLLLDAIERRPRSPFVPYLRQLLGLAYRQMGRLDEARAQLNRGRAGRPRWTDNWHDEIDAYRVSLSSRLRATAHQLSTEQAVEAVKTLEELRVEHGTNAEVLEQLGVGYLELGRLDEAREALATCVAHHPEDASAHVNLSLVELRGGSVAEARALLERSLELNPRLVSAHRGLGQIYERLGNGEEAYASYTEALRLDPTNVDLLRAAGETAGRLGRFDEAASLLDRAIARDPGNPELLSARETLERRRRR